MDSNASPLVDLLNRAREGDDAARDQLFEKCRSYVSVVAQAQVGSWLQAKVDASDLVQQTLLEAHRGFRNFNGQTDGEWLAWLKRILNNNAADYVRRYGGTAKRAARRERPLQVGNPDDSRGFCRDPQDPGESPSQLVMRREREIEVADALEKLSPDHREVIMLRNLQRLPFDEVARRMGRTRPATQMLWMRAIRKLQDLMAVPQEDVTR
jgi:RNA polymerase sigma-70 factor (ECF subfamily)